MEERKKGDEVWRKTLLRYLTLIVFLACATELLMFFYLKRVCTADISTRRYLLKYVLLPTAVNFLVIAVGYKLVYSNQVKEAYKDEIPLYCIAIIAFVLSVVHIRFAITTGVFMVPILLSVVYGREKTTRRVTKGCLLLALLNLILPMYDPQVYMPDSMMNKILSVFLIIGSYLLGKGMLLYVQQQKEELEQSTIERKRLKENLKKDAMTGLFNHVEFYRKLEEKLKQENTDIHVVVIDIDDFKKVNDTYGHEKGNDVLVELSEILTDMCGKNSHISRYGGEEFSVIFDGINSEEVYNIMEAVRRKLESTMLAGLPRSVSVSIGIASYCAGCTPQMLFEKADEAMYLAKHGGKNRIQTL